MKFRNILILGIVFLFSFSFVSAAIIDDQIGYWKFDGNASDSHGSNDGVVSGATNSIANGKINQGYGFDGTNDKINIGDSTLEFSSNDDFTISFWVKSSDTGGFVFGTSPSSDYSLNYIYLLGLHNPIFAIEANAGTGVSTSAGTTYNDGNWHFFILSHDSTNGVLSIMVDNVLKGRNTGLNSGVGTYAVSSDFLIGSLGGRENAGDFISMSIDEFSVWNKTLTGIPSTVGNSGTLECSELYNSGSGFQYPYTPVSTNDCEYSGSGNWIINQSCTIENNYTIESGKDLFILGSNTVFVKAGVTIN